MLKPSVILGVSAFYHDSAAALLIDGEIVAAAQEERFTRKKHDPAFPVNAIQYVLAEGGVALSDVESVVFYDKPYVKFERLLETYHAFAPIGLRSFLSAIPVWIKEKLFLKKLIRDELKKIEDCKTKLLFPEHHLSHAASAFYPSPYKDAAILTLDGVGEWATTTICHGKNNAISILKELDFPHSLGLLYSAFTYYCGFKVNSGEYKLMGLAPYGNPNDEQTKEFKQKILDYLVDVREDGSFLLNMRYFNYATGLTMTKNRQWKKLFGLAKRESESDLSQDYMNLALAIQQVTEDIVIKLAQTAKQLTNSDYLVMAGGVALNCVANGKLLKAGVFKDIWIQPAAGDAGGALGAALSAWHITKQKERYVNGSGDSMKGSLLGPSFSQSDIQKTIRKFQAPHSFKEDFNQLCEEVAILLDKGLVVGWFQGAMEFGPRALCNRSILGDARKPDMQKKLNLKIKYREGFRPFAPVILEERLSDFFDIKFPSPYMLMVAPVQKKRWAKEPDDFKQLNMYDRLYHCRSDVPAITHVDYSARIQSVNSKINKPFWTLLKAFEEKTNYPILVNTSFNVRGEPIVCTPEDAYRCFMRTEMDVLVLGDYILKKEDQPEWKKEDAWQKEFKLD
ncbi:MAG: carbamoyltransferase [bacterium]|nr:carbamoyltransferase [bacterium]